MVLPAMLGLVEYMDGCLPQQVGGGSRPQCTASRGPEAAPGAPRRWTYFASNWANMLWNAQMLLARVSGDSAAAAGVRDFLERWRQGRVVRPHGPDACVPHVHE